MASFDSGVSSPPTSAYGPTAVDFSWLSDLTNKYYKTKQQQFQDQQNQRTTAVQQPINTTDPSAAAAELMKRDGSYAAALMPFLQQQQNNKLAGQPDPMLPTGAPPQPQGAALQQPPAQPQKTPATQQGGDQAGSIVDLVTAKIPQEQAGPTVARIAQTIGIDPNAALTPGQAIRVNGLVQRYAQTGAAPAGSSAAAPAPAPQSPGGRVDAGFSAFPPSAGNVSPAPQPRPQQPQPQPQQQPQGQPQARPAPPQAQPQPVARPQAQQQPAPQQQQPLVPQVPLPQGYTDPQQAILALNREASLIARNKPDQAAMLQQWAKRIEASTAPLQVGNSLVDPRTAKPIYEQPINVGGTLVRPSSGDVVFQPGNALLDDQTIHEMAQQYIAGDKSVMQNLGRGAQGAQNIVRLRTAIQQEMRSQGISPSEQAVRMAEFAGITAGERTLGTKQANIEMAATEFKQVLPVVRAASAAVSRTNYPDLNKIIQMGEEKTGDPNIVKFGGGVNTLINLYARAISPSGTPTVSDKDHARDILSKAWSQGQFDAAAGMMEAEINAALNSPEKVREDMRRRFTGQGSQDAAPAASTQSPAAKKDDQGWTTMPNGVRIREMN